MKADQIIYIYIYIYKLGTNQPIGYHTHTNTYHINHINIVVYMYACSIVQFCLVLMIFCGTVSNLMQIGLQMSQKNEPNQTKPKQAKLKTKQNNKLTMYATMAKQSLTKPNCVCVLCHLGSHSSHLHLQTNIIYIIYIQSRISGLWG